MIRLWNGFKLFDVPKLMRQIKGIYKRNLEKKIEQYDSMAYDKWHDHNKIEELLFI